MFYVYIIYSTGSDRYYIGHTPDVNKRLKEHNMPQENKYTSKYLPWELILYFKVSESRADALLVERFVKNQKSREFIRKLIKEKDNQKFFDELVFNVIKKKQLVRAIPRTRD